MGFWYEVYALTGFLSVRKTKPVYRNIMVSHSVRTRLLHHTYDQRQMEKACNIDAGHLDVREDVFGANELAFLLSAVEISESKTRSFGLVEGVESESHFVGRRIAEAKHLLVHVFGGMVQP